jgi:DNA-binding XRE family transcriptional regulator
MTATDVHNTGMRRQPSVSLRLQQLRKEAGMSQVQLSVATKETDPTGRGLSDTSVCRLESGTYTPRASTVKLLADTFSKVLARRVTMDELYGAGGSLALTGYLEKERQRRDLSDQDFATLIDVEPYRYRQVRDGRGEWDVRELGAIVRALPETSPLIAATVAEFGREPATVGGE